MIPLCHVQPLTNIETLICSYASQISTSNFQLMRL